MQPLDRPIDRDAHFGLFADHGGVAFVATGDAVLVLPVTSDGSFVLLEEYSPAAGREILTLVSGEAEPDESLAVTANRELQEEVGWRAARLDYLGEFQPFKYLHTRQHLFLARELSPSKLPCEEDHPIRPRAVAPGAQAALVRSGELHDAMAIAALYLAEDYLRNEPGPP